MGTRLYPKTQDDTVLELLAEVPIGTSDRLRESWRLEENAEKNLPPVDQDDLGYRFWKERQDDPHMGKFNDFLLFGWGKLCSSCYIEIERRGMEQAVGSVDGIKDTSLFLTFMGIDLPYGVTIEQLGGLHWS